MPRPSLGLALVALATATFAQDAPRPSKVVENVRVDVVNVDVVVLDKDGNHVTDLTRDDFEIRENGRRVEISNFARFDGEPTAAPVVPDATVAPVPVPLDPESDPHRLRLVVVFDNFFTSVPSRLRALNRLEPFLTETLRGNAEVMIVSAGRRMGVALPFTADPDDVREVARRVAQATTEASAREGQTLELERQFEDALAEGRETAGLEQQAEAFGLEEFGEVRALIEMLGNVVDALSGLEGRKAILFVSDGFPVRPGDSAVFRNSVQSRYDVYGDLAELTRRANGNRVVIHSLRPTGLQAPVTGSDVQRLAGSRGGGRDALYDRARNERTANERSGLADLATATGGRVLFEGNRIESFLDEVAGDLRSYYSLGYRRDVTADRTRYQKIDVRVKRRGIRVLTRKGDFAKSSDRATEDRIRSAVLLGRASDPIGLRIVTDKAIPLPDGRFRVPILVAVPLDKIALLPRGDELAGGFRLIVGTLSSKGQMDPVRDFGYDVVVPATQMDGGSRTYPAMFTLELPAGRVHIAVGLEDDHGADLAVATAAFTLARPEGERTSAGDRR